MKKFFFLSLVLPLLLQSFSGRGQCIYTSTVAGGLFSAPSTWVVVGGGGCGAVPTANGRVIINGPVVLNQDFTTSGNNGQIIINGTGSLIEDGTARILTVGGSSGPQVLNRVIVNASAVLRTSQIAVQKSQLVVQTSAQVTTQCNLTLDNQAILTSNGATEVRGNLALVTGNALLNGTGSLLVRGCVTGSNGALQNAIQAGLAVCVRNAITTCGTGTCNGDIPINNDANCALIDPPPLPVELVRFGAVPAGEKVNVTWATASERNAREFVIERSATGREFGAIGRLDANGNSFQLLTYAWHDERPLPGTAFYRLRQVDYDGTSVFSTAVRVQIQAPTGTPQVAAWPAQTAGTYNVEVPPALPATLQILTLQGHVIQTLGLSNGTVLLDLRPYPASVYVLRAVSGLGTVTSRLAHTGQ